MKMFFITTILNNITFSFGFISKSLVLRNNPFTLGIFSSTITNEYLGGFSWIADMPKEGQ